mmetsp:Transcript_1345/g.3891  ORF Transcript_1345/g.3891 Transcript_1345/m.3891 type:complete len:479 (+) Transcript_1345:1974-3410(+)
MEAVLEDVQLQVPRRASQHHDAFQRQRAGQAPRVHHREADRRGADGVLRPRLLHFPLGRAGQDRADRPRLRWRAFGVGAHVGHAHQSDVHGEGLALRQGPLGADAAGRGQELLRRAHRVLLRLGGHHLLAIGPGEHLRGLHVRGAPVAPLRPADGLGALHPGVRGLELRVLHSALGHHCPRGLEAAAGRPGAAVGPAGHQQGGRAAAAVHRHHAAQPRHLRGQRGVLFVVEEAEVAIVVDFRARHARLNRSRGHGLHRPVAGHVGDEPVAHAQVRPAVHSAHRGFPDGYVQQDWPLVEHQVERRGESAHRHLVHERPCQQSRYPRAVEPLSLVLLRGVRQGVARGLRRPRREREAVPDAPGGHERQDVLRGARDAGHNSPHRRVHEERHRGGQALVEGVRREQASARSRDHRRGRGEVCGADGPFLPRGHGAAVVRHESGDRWDILRLFGDHYPLRSHDLVLSRLPVGARHGLYPLVG